MGALSVRGETLYYWGDVNMDLEVTYKFILKTVPCTLALASVV